MNLLDWLEPTIIKQVEVMAEAIEQNEEISTLTEQIEAIHQTLLGALETEEHKKLLDKMDCLFGERSGLVELFAYRTGLIEGILMQQGINSLAPGDVIKTIHLE